MTPVRELSADLYRVVAVIVVAIGHWLVSAVTYRDGRFGNDYPLDVLPWTQWLTLLFQVVPVFFLVGGYASAASWLHWRDAGGRRRSDWVRQRLGAILGPTAVYAAVALGVVAALVLAGVGRSPLSFGGWAVAMHLWFVPVYLVVVALTPVAMAAHRRWGLLVPAVLALAVAGVDLLARSTGVAVVGAANYVLCWAAVYQLGICWRGGALSGRRPVVLAAVGVVALAVLLGSRWYPISMVGAPGATAQNNFPPNAALLAFSAAQAGLLVAASSSVTRRLERSRLRRPLAVASRNVMALYLWQMVPVVVVALIAYPAGLFPQPATGTGAWWWFRLAWLGILSVVTAGELALVWMARRVTATALPTKLIPLPGWCATPLLVVGIVSSTVALAGLAVYGFAPDGHFPTTGTLLLAVGICLLSVTTVVPQGISSDQPHSPSRY
ncbi:MAG: acyltransferase family protein [Mycobacterium sp.]